MTRRVQRSVGQLAAHGALLSTLTFSVAGCASSGALAAASLERDSVLYVSARARVDGRDSHVLADTLQYGVAIVARRLSSPADPSGAPLGSVVDSVALTESQFVALLRERTGTHAAPYDFAVLYVHGFGTSLHEAWRYTAAAERQARSSAPWIAFCWPSHGAAISWPRGGALVLGAYKQDSVNARASGLQFLRALGVVTDAVGAERVLVATHSLGAQVVGDALISDTINPVGPPLRALAFMTPDMEATYFRDSLVPFLLRRSRRIALYTSSNDRALTLGYLTDGFERAGRRTDPPLIHPGLEVIDVTRGLAREGWFQRAFGTHHAVHRKTSMLQDVVHIVGAERDATCRSAMHTARFDGAYWSLAPVPMPPEDSLATCTRPVKEPPP